MARLGNLSGTMARLLALDPGVAQAVTATIQSGDSAAIEKVRIEAEQGLRNAKLVMSKKTFAEKQSAFREIIADKISKGLDVSQNLQTLNLPEDEFNTKMQRMIIGGTDIQTLTAPAIQRPIITENAGETTPENALGQQETPPEIEDGITFAETRRIKGKPKDDKPLFKMPSGFQLLDPNDQTKGITPIPGGPRDNFKGETAAKVQMMRTARKAAEGINAFIFDEEGELDRINLFNAQFNTPFSEGRELRTKMEFGIQAITRLETGAAMPPEEVENTRLRFMPTVGDTKEIAELKIEMFNDFLSGVLKLIDPSGRLGKPRFNAEAFDAEFKRRLKDKLNNEVDPSKMTTEELLKAF